MKRNSKKLISKILKIGLSIFLLYLVFSKISITEIYQTVKEINILYFLAALLFFLWSQFISAIRLLLFFKEVGYHLSPKSNNVLYLIGMFYNFFIPGGIGGDAYKIYVLNKTFNWKLKTLTAAVFIDRFMGLTAIGFLIVILSYTILATLNLVWSIPILLAIILISSYFFVKQFFPKFLKAFAKGFFYSLAVQGLQVLSVVCLILSLGSEQNIINYIFVFLISSVLSIFSFAGIGVREYIFYEASQILNIDSSIPVSIGLLFSILTALVSLFGIYYHLRKPKLTKEILPSENE